MVVIVVVVVVVVGVVVVVVVVVVVMKSTEVHKVCTFLRRERLVKSSKQYCLKYFIYT